MARKTTERPSVQSVLKQLESLGTAQNRKVYARHGVGTAMFGVSYASLGKLRKALKTDQDLAEGLWASGNHDARVLATMVADPRAVGARLLDAWKKDLDNYVVADAFTAVAAASPAGRKKMDAWMRARNEWVASVGWGVLVRLAQEPDLPDSFFEPYLATIEERIHASKNRVRYAMNGALIAIGIRSAGLEKKAVAAARRIGSVEVDHGRTGCKTPDAEPYIRKARARRRSR